MAEPNNLRELTLSRIHSFLRELAALFWTFGFPIMSIGLGLAFREPPAERRGRRHRIRLRRIDICRRVLGVAVSRNRHYSAGSLGALN